MLDWLEYILNRVTAADEATEELPGLLTAQTVISPVRQAAAVLDESPAENGGHHSSAAYAPLLRSFLWNSQSLERNALPDVLDQAAHTDSEYSVSVPDSALSALYRRTEEAVSRAALPGLSGVSAAGHGQVTVVQGNDPAPPGLTAQELDRAIRRDSRRFDGGMNIY